MGEAKRRKLALSDELKAHHRDGSRHHHLATGRRMYNDMFRQALDQVLEVVDMVARNLDVFRRQVAK